MRQQLTIEQLNRGQLATLSTKYKNLNTYELSQFFTSQGYTVRSIQEQRYTANNTNKGHGKHLIRLQHEAFSFKDSSVIPEIVIRNSNNGKSSFEIMLGLYRLVCANGLVVGSTYSSYKVKHLGNALEQVKIAMQNIQSQAIAVQSQIDKMRRVILAPNQIELFALKISEQLVPKNAFNVQHRDLLEVRRGADSGQDLWTVLNVIQENALRRGVKYQLHELTERGLEIRNNKTREIKGIDRNILINKAIWSTAERFIA